MVSLSYHSLKEASLFGWAASAKQQQRRRSKYVCWLRMATSKAYTPYVSSDHTIPPGKALYLIYHPAGIRPYPVYPWIWHIWLASKNFILILVRRKFQPKNKTFAFSNNSSPLTGRRYVEASGKSEAVTRKLVFLFYFTYIYNSRYDSNRNEGAHTVYTYTSRVR